MHHARCALNEAPALLRLYNALTIMTDLPASSPNSGPNAVHVFSLLGAITKAYNTSVALTSRSCNTAIVRAVHTVSLVTTLEQVRVSSVWVIWPPATRHAYLWKSSILMSNNIWQLTY